MHRHGRAVRTLAVKEVRTMLFLNINVRGRGERERKREWRVLEGGNNLWFGGRSKGTLVPYPYPVLVLIDKNATSLVGEALEAGSWKTRTLERTITNACVRKQNLCIKLGATYSLRRTDYLYVGEGQGKSIHRQKSKPQCRFHPFASLLSL